jgi:cephalosporin-C deacetylase-like acetyl esterase
MVAGIDRMADRLIENARDKRHPTREKLVAILGVVDSRIPFSALEWIGDTLNPAVLLETDTVKVSRVRWSVFEDFHGEGIFVQPKAEPLARIIYLPDADVPPERLVDEMLLSAQCEIIIPALTSRASTHSGNERLGIRTDLSHREWIYRQSFECGRHIIGFEIQKALALVDWFRTRPVQLPILVAGLGEGGLIALHTAAIDTRVDAAYVAGYFAPREKVWQEPLYRNVFGLLRNFGDAEVASLIAPRPLVIQHLGFPQIQSTTPAAGIRQIAAPGRLEMPLDQSSEAEVERARSIIPGNWIRFYTQRQGIKEVVRSVFPQVTASAILSKASSNDKPIGLPVDSERQRRQVRQLQNLCKQLVVDAEAERESKFWKELPLKSSEAFESHIATERERFWRELIGRLPDPDLPAHVRTRSVFENDKVSVHEVVLDVWEDVFAWGLLCVPKGIAAPERRPVVVCQHGLEGLPADVVEGDPTQKAWSYYKGFALALAERGFVTFAPHNPYRGKESFRVLQRKLNPMGLTLFSVIAGQHQRILEWLGGLSFVDSSRIGFYGLSYGGKSAMRLPAILPGYALSICSGDFNEWIRKCVSTDLPQSYVFTSENEIWEWDLARHFNYAEMAALIAPRPFMVERGHEDGVARDEWVNYEFAKVRRLFDRLSLQDRTAIEHFNGPHTIHGEGTFEFLHRHLKWPVPASQR